MARDHAVVLGGSITGLLAAAALAEDFERVTIVDRDELLVDGPEASQARRGVPQGDQVHHLLALGAQRIEELLPGLTAELEAQGCEKHDNLAAFAQWSGSSWRVRVPSELDLICFTRPVFEWVIRRRVLALPNVTALKSMVTGLLASDDGATVVGVQARKAPGGEVRGDLVVDATGRGTKAPNWFEHLGFARPQASHLNVYMGYTCLRVRIPEGVLPEGVVSVASGSAPGSTQSMVIWPCGRGEHIVVGFGAVRDYPPADLDGLIALADRLPVPHVARCLRAATVISEPKAYQMAGDQRLWWEDLDRRPEGFVALGDAVGSYNPAYGQGMTMASVGATELRRALRENDGEIVGLAQRFQKALAPHVDVAWENALTFDANFAGVEYENLTPPQAASPEFARAFLGLQSTDPEVALAARRAMHWMDPGHLRNETIGAKISAWIAGGHEVPAEMTDPTSIPAPVRSPEAAPARA